MSHISPGWIYTPCQLELALEENYFVTTHFPEQRALYHSEIITILSGDKLISAAKLLLPKNKQSSEEEAVIDWIAARPESTRGVPALVQEMKKRAMQQGAISLTSSGRFGLGFGWPGIALFWKELMNVLSQKGFEFNNPMTVMTAAVQEPIKASPPAQFKRLLHLDFDKRDSGTKMHAWLGEEIVGECECWQIPSHFSEHPDFAEWITIEWLGVNEPYQRKGLGQFVLASHMNAQYSKGAGTSCYGRRPITWLPKDWQRNVVLKKPFKLRQS